MVEKRVVKMRKILKEDVPNWLLEINISYHDLIADNFEDATVTSVAQQKAFVRLSELSKSLKKCTDVHRNLIEGRYLRQLPVKSMMGKMMVRHSRYYDIENESLLELSKRYLQSDKERKQIGLRR